MVEGAELFVKRKMCLELRNWVVSAANFLQFLSRHELMRAEAAAECMQEHLYLSQDCDSLRRAAVEVYQVGLNTFEKLGCTVLMRKLHGILEWPWKPHCALAVSAHLDLLYSEIDFVQL